MNQASQVQMVLSVVERRILKKRRPTPAPPPPPPPPAAAAAMGGLVWAVGGAVVGLAGWLLQRTLSRKRAEPEAEPPPPPARVDETPAPPPPREAAQPQRKSHKVQWADASRPVLQLQLTAGSQAGTLFCVPPHLTEVCIGRVATNDLVINDTEVSSQHARLAWDAHGATWQLVDVGSLNGTRLNGVMVGRPNRAAGAWHALSHGDIIHFGERDESPAARVALMPPPPVTPPPGGPRAPCAGGADADASATAGEAAADAEAAAAAPAAPPPLRVPVGVSEDAARGRPSEDRWLAECPLRGHPDAALFCVFDGHCGAGAAERAAALLPAHVAAVLAQAGPLPCDDDAPASPGGGPGGAAAALRAAFLATDAALRCEYEGCAATAVLVWRDPPGCSAADADAEEARDAARADGARSPRGARPAAPPRPRRLFVQAANVGDASAALAARYACWLADGGAEPPAPLSTHPSQAPALPPELRPGGPGGAGASAPSLLPPLRALRLTEDHKVKSASERARLAAAGVQLAEGETRLYGLALSRALGDSFLKEDAASGLTAEPHVSRVAVVHAGEGAFALLASDGLWDVVAPPAAVELVNRARSGGVTPPGVVPGGIAAPVASWDEAAAALVATARQRRSRDDCTVMLLSLDPALRATDGA